MPTYKLREGSLQERFDKLRMKVQVYGGGFANGKTSASVVLKILKVAKDYPGANILVARSTYPRLNDTIRKEFIKWCPKDWIKSFPMSANASNTCTLTNGTEINFRYVSQVGKGSGQSTSNLLSATYDLIVVDQIEDPEITKKDFDDLFGRLRGTAEYIGDDPTMPETGPRWLVVTCNPTRNWFYKHVIKPYLDWQRDGLYHEGLICEKESGTEDEEGEPILDHQGHAIPIMGLVEGSTYDNKENLAADFIRGLESLYRGEMRARFLMGMWKGFEGLVYKEYESTIHTTSEIRIFSYLEALRKRGYNIHWLDAYDYGLAVPSCYILAFIDPSGRIICVDGFYEAELAPEEQVKRIRAARSKFIFGMEREPAQIWADPSIFRRSGGNFKTVGESTASIFWDNGRGVSMTRANNDIINGVIKVQSYLAIDPTLHHPFNVNVHGSPRFIFSDTLSFIDTEITDYYWEKDSEDKAIDKPMDRNDHAMDTLRYLLTSVPEVSKIIPQFTPQIPSYLRWNEAVDESNRKAHRYG